MMTRSFSDFENMKAQWYISNVVNPGQLTPGVGSSGKLSAFMRPKCILFFAVPVKSLFGLKFLDSYYRTYTTGLEVQLLSRESTNHHEIWNSDLRWVDYQSIAPETLNWLHIRSPLLYLSIKRLRCWCTNQRLLHFSLFTGHILIEDISDDIWW